VEGCGETGFPHAPAPQGDGETRFPHPSADAGRRPAHPGPGPWEGLGGRSPPKNNRMFIAAFCGAAAWTAEVTIVRRVQPPPASPRRGEAPGSLPQRGEGQGRGRRRVRGAVARASRPRSRVMVIGRWVPCA